jgi:hypothetical protein
MRNGFDIIKAFYSWVFNNQEINVKAQHISLYMFFVNQNNRNNWIEWFKCPYDLAMTGSAIRTKRDYYNILHDLEKWGLIGYIAGQAMHKSPLISLVEIRTEKTDKPMPKSKVVGYQYDTQHDTQHDTQPSTQPDTQHDTQPDTRLGTHIKHITSNLNTYKPVTGNLENSEKFSDPDIEILESEYLEDLHYSPRTLKAENDQREVPGEPDKTETFTAELWPTFNDFWEAYDKKRGDQKKLKKKWETLKQSEKEKILEYIPNYKLAQPDKNFRKDPQTFLNNKSWNDEIITAKSANLFQSSTAPQNHFARLLEKINRSSAGG